MKFVLAKKCVYTASKYSIVTYIDFGYISGIFKKVLIEVIGKIN